MFGRTVDNRILRPFCHDRHKLSAEEIEIKNRIPLAFEKISSRYRKLEARFGSFLSFQNKRVLDVGSGNGGIALAIALRGAESVTAVEINEQRNRTAILTASRMGIRNVEFIKADFLAWPRTKLFDVILSIECFEHYRNPEQFWTKMVQCLRPNGCILVILGGTWHGPYVDHLENMFRIPIPWRHLLFNEQALLDLRTEFFRPDEAAVRFEDFGINRITHSQFLEGARTAGLKLKYKRNNWWFTENRRLRPLHPISQLLMGMPYIGKYFIINGAYVFSKS